MPASYANTLRYWFDVEALTYPELPKPGSRRHYILRYQVQLPWQKDPTEKNSENQKYFVYFGLVQKAVLDPELFELFHTRPDEEDPSGACGRKMFKQGKTFLLAIEVSGDGTVQDKESEMVIFVLGGKTSSVRSWAASRSNTVNVAVTRVKRRHYVIGNARAWGSMRFGTALHDGINQAVQQGLSPKLRLKLSIAGEI